MLLPKLSFIPPIIAHRGASDCAPENTLAAFRKAKELGIQWVEFDVMLTCDEEIVVIHDETLERTTSGMGSVASCTWAELKKLDAGSWFNPLFHEERIVTLVELIELLSSLEMQANIEIKAQLGKEALTVKKVLEVVDKHWPAHAFPPLISSFSREILNQVRLHSTSTLIGVLLDEWQEEWRQVCDELNAISVNINQRLLTQARVQAIKETQHQLLAYTVNAPKRAQELFAWGVDAVFSDCPDAMVNAFILK